MTFLIDGVTPLPTNGQAGWGTILNAAINAIDGRFTWTSGEAVVSKVAASGVTGATLASNVVSSSLTSVGTLTSLNVSGSLVVGGNLTINGTTTTINSTTISVDDINITLGDTASPTDTSANGGGITLKGTTDKTFNWVSASTAWVSSENLSLASGKAYYINGSSVLSATALGSGVTSSSLTSVGTLTALTVSGTTILGPASINGQSSAYTLALSDQGKVIEMTNSSDVAITIPPSGTTNFPTGAQIVVIRNSTGKVSFTPGSGVTLRSDSSKQYIATQYSAATLVKRATDEWYLIGNLSAS